jgi:hypothetical protein
MPKTSDLFDRKPNNILGKAPKPKAATPKRPKAPKSTQPPADFVQAIKDIHYAQEDGALESVLAMGPMLDAMMGGHGTSLIVHFVVKAAEHVLQVEDGGKGDPADVARAREQYTKTLTRVRKALGGKFDALYSKKLKEHNECGRANLDSSKGTMYCYVIPRFNDDGTHDPLGPRDFPWNAKG